VEAKISQIPLFFKNLFFTIFPAIYLVFFAKNNLSVGSLLCLTHYHPVMPFGNRKKYFRGSFQFSIVAIKKKAPGNLIFDYLGIFESLKSRISMEKNPLNLNFTPNT